MDRAKLVESINAEIAKLKHAVSLLEGDAPTRTAVKGKGNRAASYIMNPAARKKISDAQKKRWDKVREDKLKAERAATEKFKSASSTPKKK